MDTKGTYCLVLLLPAETAIVVGRLGTFRFPAGYYLYMGSALGPGGLPARTSRYLRSVYKPHWHIDYLLQHAILLGIGHEAGSKRQECAWAKAALSLPGASIPAPGFGASDCRCPSHLIYLGKRPVIPNDNIFKHQIQEGLSFIPPS